MIETIFNFDLYLAEAVVAWRSVWLTPIMIFFTRLGDDQIAYPFVAITVLLLLLGRRLREATLLLLTLLLSAVTNTGLKELVGRVRPLEHQLVVETDFSFPSGHAMNSLVYFGLLSYLVFRHVSSVIWRRFLIALAFTFSLFMGFSRVYLGVHYLSDIVAGYLLGACFLSVAIWVGERWKARTTGLGLREEDTIDV